MVHIRMAQLSGISGIPKWKLWLIGSGLIGIIAAVALASLALAMILVPITAIALALRGFFRGRTKSAVVPQPQQPFGRDPNARDPGVIDVDYVEVRRPVANETERTTRP